MNDMQAYIERNLAETVIKKLVESDCTPFDKQEALDNLCSIPTADVYEVKHGKWIFINQATNYLESPCGDTCRCSICGYEIDVSDTYSFRYCPHCDAKMDRKD